MQRGRRDSVAFTVVVAALVLLGAIVMAAVVAFSGAPGTLAARPARHNRLIFLALSCLDSPSAPPEYPVHIPAFGVY